MCQRHFFFNVEKIIIRTKNSDLKRHSNLLSARSITTRQDKKVINYFSIKILHEKQLVIIIFTHLALYVEEDIDDDEKKQKFINNTQKKTKIFSYISNVVIVANLQQDRNPSGEKNFFNFASGTEKVIGMLTKDVIWVTLLQIECKLRVLLFIIKMVNRRTIRQKKCQEGIVKD